MFRSRIWLELCDSRDWIGALEVCYVIDALYNVSSKIIHVTKAQPAKYDKIKEMIQDPKDGQQIVRIISSRDNNVHEVETADTGTMTNRRYASNYVKETCDENVEEFEEKFSGPCHLSPNRNRPRLLVAFEDESTSSKDDS
ncbi:hypothetical protein GQX74_014131 [Glossina fuscipes]|nr:hypothetical protein GQX74_014131 [Glossina fuscipes]